MSFPSFTNSVIIEHLPNKHCDNFRVKLFSRTSFQFAHRRLHIESPPIRTIAGHGVKSVGDRHHPARQRNIDAANPQGIPLPVPPLMVFENIIRNARKFHGIFRNPAPYFTVPLYFPSFLQG